MKAILAAFAVIAILMAVGVVIAQTPEGSANTNQGTSATYSTEPATTTPTADADDSTRSQTMPNDETPASGGTSGETQGMSTTGSSDEASMPRTASPYPLFAVLGLAACGLGGVLALRRRSA